MQIVKQLWAYIRKNNLQDPSNKRKIICNDELRLVFETDCTDMFQMNKLLAKHITPLDPTSIYEYHRNSILCSFLSCICEPFSDGFSNDCRRPRSTVEETKG